MGVGDGWLFRWMALRAQGNSLGAKICIIVPLVGYLILFNSNIVDYLKLHTSICEGRSCDVSWRLLFLYFGGTAYGVAAAVFALACPIVVKSYASAAEYLAEEGDYFVNVKNLRYLIDQTRADKGPIAPSTDTLIGSESEFQRPLQDGELAEIMGNFFITQNYKFYWARLVCFVCFVSGIFLVSIPTVFTFGEVLLVALKRAFGG